MVSPELIAGRYRVLRPVGRGGMGTVWLCRDEILGRDVAVKKVGHLPGDSVPDAARALREARTAAALNHKNVVSIFDVVSEDDENWLVMEYVPSRTLSAMLREEGPLSPARAARIGSQIADGLAAAHALGTVHRDVKPGNILVSDHDEAKLSDFGISRTVGEEPLTQTGLMTGTPAYFSPELARGDDPGPAADVWALGATLYAAVQGSSPYPEQRNPLAMLQVIATTPPPRPSAAGPLTEPITRMLDPTLTSRWSMADAAHALRRIAGPAPAAYGEPGTEAFGASPEPALALREAPVRATTLRSRPERYSREQRAGGPLLWLAGLLFVGLMAVAGYQLLGAGDDGRQTASGAPRTDDGPGAGAPATRSSATPRAGSGATASASATASDSTPVTSPSPATDTSPSADASPPPDASEPAGGAQGGPAGGSAMAQSVRTYFATVPADRDAGWSQLSPAMQADVGRSSYDRFWGSILEVQVGDARPVSGSNAVDVLLTYTFSDGRVVQEQQRISLDRSGNRYLIAGNVVQSSRTVSG